MLLHDAGSWCCHLCYALQHVVGLLFFISLCLLLDFVFGRGEVEKAEPTYSTYSTHRCVSIIMEFGKTGRRLALPIDQCVTSRNQYQRVTAFHFCIPMTFLLRALQSRWNLNMEKLLPEVDGRTQLVVTWYFGTWYLVAGSN